MAEHRPDWLGREDAPWVETVVEHVRAHSGTRAGDWKLEREENRPFPDSNLIISLKKQKLHLKDVLTQEALPA